jgi:histidinol-phosphate aminotransferase
MPTSRRDFLHLLGVNGVAAATWRPSPGQPSLQRTQGRMRQEAAGAIRLSSNENSHGPGSAVLDAIQGAFPKVNRYSFAAAGDVQASLARKLNVQTEQVVLGCGSSEILDAAVIAFTSPEHGVVTASPTFELVGDLARHMSRPVVEVPVTDALELDLPQMADKAAGAGLIYICNPNNPTGTLHGAKPIEEFVAAALKREPKVTILIDEAYHEYVERADYRSAIPLALSEPRVVVSRTFSKIYGIAGLRCGYAVGHRDTIRQVSKSLDPLRISVLTTRAALTALADPTRAPTQRQLNHDARTYTEGLLRAAGYPSIPSEANFVMVNVKRDIRQFQAACRERGVEIARPFPPLLTYARITIGTMDEMHTAGEAFRQALAAPPTSARLAPIERTFRRDGVWEC